MSGVVYFIGGKRGAVKIGSTSCLKKRLARIQSHSPVKLYILATTAPGTANEEPLYHCRFKADRLHCEWFRRSPALLEEIRRLQATAPYLSGEQ